MVCRRKPAKVRLVLLVVLVDSTSFRKHHIMAAADQSLPVSHGIADIGFQSLTQAV